MRHLFILILVLSLTACGGKVVATETVATPVFVSPELAPSAAQLETTPVPDAEPSPFASPTRQPTIVPTQFQLPTNPPTETPTPIPISPSTTPDCLDGLVFLSDVTVPDGTIVSPGEKIDKRWQVKNSGTCNWGPGYQIRRISGDELGITSPLGLFPARNGAKAVIQIIFTAPDEAGAYRSAWQAYNPKGEAFGDPIFVDFIVTGNPL